MEQRLSAFSDQLADRVAHAAPGLVTLFPGTRAQRTGFAWGPNLVVTSEQNLPHETEVQIVLPGGGTATARMAGRDNGTNVAVLALPIEAPTMTDAVPRVGGLALALGAAEGGPTASMGLVHQVGPAWDSMAGGTIDHLVRLDLRLSAAAEGGPVLDGAGALLGMSTFGPRRRVLVIPAATIRRVLPALAEGRAARGWMGVALQPVQLPPALAETAGRETGLLVASLAKDGPAARAGVHPGDILLAVAGAAATHPRATARALGQHAAGQAVGLDLLRGGSPLHLSVTLEARPPRMMLTLAPPRALSIAVTARDPVRAADLAARVTLAGHTVVEPDAAPDLVLADAASPVAPDQAVLRMGLGAPLPAELSPGPARRGPPRRRRGPPREPPRTRSPRASPPPRPGRC